MGPASASASGNGRWGGRTQEVDHIYPTLSLGRCSTVGKGETLPWRWGSTVQDPGQLALVGGPQACKEAGEPRSQALGHSGAAGCLRRAENGVGALRLGLSRAGWKGWDGMGDPTSPSRRVPGLMEVAG